MPRSFVLLLALAALPAVAQTTVGASVSVVPLTGGFAGESSFLEPSATVVRLDASHPVGRVVGAGLTVEAALSAASTTLLDGEDASPLALRTLEVGLALGRARRAGERARIRLGAVLDVGPDFYTDDPFDESVSTDGSHALRLGADVQQPAGTFALWAGADVFLTPARRVDIPYTDIENPMTDSTITFRVRTGHTLVLRAGASRAVGPVTLGAELVSGLRSASTSEGLGSSLPPSREEGATVVSVVPSVAWRGAGVTVEAAVRAPGLLWNEHVETGVPLAVDRARVARWPLSLRVAYDL